VTAVKAGTAIITVKTDDGGYTATCTLTIKAMTVPVTGVTLDKTTAELSEGETLTLMATVNPSNASNRNVRWSSDDESVATVDADGKVTAVGVGSARITVETEDGGFTASCAVTIKAKTIPVTGVALDITSAKLVEGETLLLTPAVNPSDASDKNVTWSSSDGSVATVDEKGLLGGAARVTAVKAGTATITVRTEDGDFSATCAISVTARKDGGIDDYNNEHLNW